MEIITDLADGMGNLLEDIVLFFGNVIGGYISLMIVLMLGFIFVAIWLYVRQIPNKM